VNPGSGGLGPFVSFAVNQTTEYMMLDCSELYFEKGVLFAEVSAYRSPYYQRKILYDMIPLASNLVIDFELVLRNGSKSNPWYSVIMAFRMNKVPLRLARELQIFT